MREMRKKAMKYPGDDRRRRGELAFSTAAKHDVLIRAKYPLPEVRYLIARKGYELFNGEIIEIGPVNFK